MPACAALDPAAGGQGEQLGAEADAEQRGAGPPRPRPSGRGCAAARGRARPPRRPSSRRARRARRRRARSAGSGSPRSGRRTSSCGGGLEVRRLEPAETGVRPGAGRRGREGHCRPHEQREVAVELERGDLLAVVRPLLRACCAGRSRTRPRRASPRRSSESSMMRDRLGQARGQRLDAERPALGVGQRPDVVLGALGQVEALVDALQAGGQHHARTPGRGCRRSRARGTRPGSSCPCRACTSARGSVPSGCCGPSRRSSAPRRRPTAACRS